MPVDGVLEDQPLAELVPWKLDDNNLKQQIMCTTRVSSLRNAYHCCVIFPQIVLDL